MSIHAQTQIHALTIVNVTTAIVDVTKSKDYVERLESLTSDTKSKSETKTRGYRLSESLYSLCITVSV